jgi:hypothetical protein
MKSEIEIYLARFFRSAGGGIWLLTFFEIQNFTTGSNWCLFLIQREPGGITLKFNGES